MKNIKKSTGYLIVIVFWLATIMMFSSCALPKAGCGGSPKHLGN